MVTENHPLIQLLQLVDMVWSDEEVKKGRGAPKVYHEKVMFKEEIMGKTLVMALFAGESAHPRGLWFAKVT